MTRASSSNVWLVVVALPLLFGSSAAPAQDEGVFDRTPKDCLVVSSVDDTDVLDDQNIVFTMRNNRVYRNHLPRKCPGLGREGRFMYETHSARLCSIDTITVLEQFGVGLQRGFTCRLGEFVPLSPEEIEDLESLHEGGPTQDDIDARPVKIEKPEQPAAETPVPPASPDEACN